MLNKSTNPDDSGTEQDPATMPGGSPVADAEQADPATMPGGSPVTGRR